LSIIFVHKTQQGETLHSAARGVKGIGWDLASFY
jgi:hypothetical protein